MHEHFDVIIVGGGLSGINAAYRLQSSCAGKLYTILENRDTVGGTWDLFRYPGIRSDSDMFTFSYPFRPWQSNSSIAHGDSIRTYIRETAEAYGIDRHIRFRHRVKSASWSSEDTLWTVTVERGPAKEIVNFTCNFLFCCTGYYDYAAGYAPEFPDAETFRGRIVHPQHWPQDLDYAGKRVVVVGSGATAVTIIPVIAETAANVTMLQRSPTYIVSRPSHDRLAASMRRLLPTNVAYSLVRWRNLLLGLYFYKLCMRRPDKVKVWIGKHIRKLLGDDFDVGPHFTPRYNPWEQRLCFSPDADFFSALRDGKADIVTDHIKSFTPDGIRLTSGSELKADIIVTATGLNMQMLGGIVVDLDGKRNNFAETMNFRGVMFSNIPNLFNVFGYVNASWTLKSDLIAAYVARLINYMDRRDYASCTPRVDPAIEPAAFIELSSGYIQRAADRFPQQGSRKPWKLNQNYVRDFLSLRLGPINDRALEFTPRRNTAATAA